MPQSLAAILVHVIFSTKNREPFIQPEIELELSPGKMAMARFPSANPGLRVSSAHIANQKEHHRVKSFQEEYLQFLNRYNIEYDERDTIYGIEPDTPLGLAAGRS